MSHPKLKNPVVDDDVLEGLANATDGIAGIAVGDLDGSAREIIYRFLEDLPDSWSIQELMEKMEGKETT
jgi:predicted transcriptional regulator